MAVDEFLGERDWFLRPRTEDFGITFGGPHRTAAGWFMPVPDLCRARLDIHRLDGAAGGGEWTQGTPPVYAFKSDDVLCDPPDLWSMKRADAAKVCRRLVKVVSARGDSSAGGGPVKPGALSFIVWTGPPFVPEAGQLFVGTQKDFVAYLRDGIVPVPPRGKLVRYPVARGMRIWMEWRDSQGRVFELTIIPVSLAVGPDGEHIYGHIEGGERGQATNFRVTRIRRAIDLATGEVCDDGDGRTGEVVKGWLRAHTIAVHARLLSEYLMGAIP